MNNYSLILHLFYYNSSKYLIDKISKFYPKENKIYISLVKNREDNIKILDYLTKYFSNIVVNEERNTGTDQYGLYKLFDKYEQEFSDWILYFHDKHEEKLHWIDDLVDPFVLNKDSLSNILNDSNYGMIVSNNKQYYKKLLTEEQLSSLMRFVIKKEKITILRSLQTTSWVRILQSILQKETGLNDEKNLYFDFVAGNMFGIRKSILKLSLSCIHEDFFENDYRQDGDIGHGLERFYFYVNSCLKYKLCKIGAENE